MKLCQNEGEKGPPQVSEKLPNSTQICPPKNIRLAAKYLHSPNREIGNETAK
jgi:hypothetical protein